MNKPKSLFNIRTLFLLALLLCVACWFGIVSPLYSKWQEKQNLSQSKKRHLLENLKVLARREWIEENYKKIPQALKSNKPNAQEIAQFQNVITDLAKQTGVKVQKTKTRPIQEDPLSKQIWLELDCQGKILQLSDFVYRLQTSPESIQLQQLRLSLQDDKSSTLRASMVVNKLLILE